MQSVGVNALVTLISHLCFIYLAYWALQALRLDQFFKKFQEARVRFLLLLAAIVIGYQVSQFFLEILTLTRNFVSLAFS